MKKKASVEATVRNIRRKTWRKYSAEASMPVFKRAPGRMTKPMSGQRLRKTRNHDIISRFFRVMQ